MTGAILGQPDRQDQRDRPETLARSVRRVLRDQRDHLGRLVRRVLKGKPQLSRALLARPVRLVQPEHRATQVLRANPVLAASRVFAANKVRWDQPDLRP